MPVWSEDDGGFTFAAWVNLPEPVKLWDGGALPNAAAVPLAKGARVHTIKEGAKGLWMKGVHVAWHKETLYAQFEGNFH